MKTAFFLVLFLAAQSVSAQVEVYLHLNETELRENYPKAKFTAVTGETPERFFEVKVRDYTLTYSMHPIDGTAFHCLVEPQNRKAADAQQQIITASQNELSPGIYGLMSSMQSNEVAKIYQDPAKTLPSFHYYTLEPRIEIFEVEADDINGWSEVVVAEEPAFDQDEPLSFVEVMPVFAGCEKLPAAEQVTCTQTKMVEFVGKHMQYPQDAVGREIQGVVYVGFVVEHDGSVTNIEVLRTPDPLLSKVAIDIIRKLPNYTPGKQRGETVRVKMVLPVRFALH
jgi:TonB family protein